MHRILLAALPLLAALGLSGCGSIVNQLSDDPQPFGGPARDVAMAAHLGERPMNGKQTLGALAFLFGDMALSSATDLFIYGVIIPLWPRHDDDFPVTYSAAAAVQTDTSGVTDPSKRAYSLAHEGVVDGLAKSSGLLHTSPAPASGARLNFLSPPPPSATAELSEQGIKAPKLAAFAPGWAECVDHGPAGDDGNEAPVTTAAAGELRGSRSEWSSAAVLAGDCVPPDVTRRIMETLTVDGWSQLNVVRTNSQP
jgi:hypothetical protein